MLDARTPEPGQLVTVRQRRYVVAEVQPSTLPSPPTTRPGLHTPISIVRLTSVEDDGLGEELSVVWQLEPGAQVIEKAVLPEHLGFDAPRKLDAFLDAVRWGAISSADNKTLHAPFRSGITIEDYQLDPVVRALQMPRVNLLIADDVGLGKTIETGLVIQELLLRHRARTVLIVCPAAIQVQWRDQMRDKFGLEFRIVDSTLMKELRRRRGIHVNPWDHFPRLITSIDFLKRERPMRLLRDLLPAEGQPAFPRRFDLLVVDEAHNVAPSGSTHYAIDSQRTRAIRTLSPHFEHRLFLSATPHNGYTESFTALLELLDNQRFHRGVKPDEDQLRVIMVRRLKSELPPRWDGSPRFPQRKLEPLEVDWTDAERTAHQTLAKYARLRRERARTEAEKFATEFVLKLLKKRMFSSPIAFQTTLQQHIKSLKGHRREDRAVLSVLRQQVETIEEEYADDDAYEEATLEVADAASRLLEAVTVEEQTLLDQLLTWAEKAVRRPDTKAKALLDWLKRTVRDGERWTDERVILFTEYRATQKWLHQLFAEQGLASHERVLTLYGGMATEDRERVKAAFQARPSDSPVRILLATDAASEGIDLQNHCHRLLHYEIPWNPNRMEQRNGRVDRHGQRASEVLIYHFVGRGYLEATLVPRPPGDLDGDLEFLMRAALKVENIREDLGKVGPVIAEQVEQAMLGKRKHLDVDRAVREAEPVRRMLKFERKLREQLQKLHDQLHETRQTLRLSPDNVRTVVEIGLELAGQPPLRETTLEGVWPPSPASVGTGKHPICPVFHLPPLRGTWAPCGEGLAHPHTGVIRPLVFDHALAEGRDDVVLAHLHHRLVQMCLRLLRAELWAPEGRRGLNRVTARRAAPGTLKEPMLIGHARLVVLGTDNVRLHEEVISAGGSLRSGRFHRQGVTGVETALEKAMPEEVSDDIKVTLLKLWPDQRDALLQALDARMRERVTSLSRVLQERMAREVEDLTKVLQELARTLQEELKSEPPLQLLLFSDQEKDQLARDRDSLQARLDAIPAEITRETAAIRRRYAEPTPRMFPVAVEWVVG